MKNLFMLAAKCFGVYLVFQGILAGAPYSGFLRSASSIEPGFRNALVAQALIGFLTAAAGLCMIVYSGKFAEILGVSGPIEPPEFSPTAFLRVGLVLIGISHIMKAAPRLLGQIIAYDPNAVEATAKSLAARDITGLLLALLLVIRAAAIARAIEKLHKTS